MQIFAGTNNFVPSSTTKTLHSKAGKLRGIIASATAQATIVFYDNTSGAVPHLLILDISAYQTIVILFDNLLPLTFSTGLTVVTSANCHCMVITEL